MKKFLCVCLTVLLLAAMVGCGAGEAPEQTEEVNIFLGTWRSSDLFYEVWAEEWSDTVNEFVINADGTCSFSGVSQTPDGFSDYERTGTWELQEKVGNEQTLIVRPEGADTINDCHTMIFVDGQMYVRSRVTRELFKFEKGE